MARSRASPSRSGGASRHHTSSAPPPAAHTQHTTSHSQQQQQKTASPPPPHSQPTPQVTNVYVQRGGPVGGAGSGMLGTMAAVAGGSVIGHGISNYLYGHNNQAPTQPAEAQQLAQQAAKEGYACTPQLTGYSKCLEANADNAEQCKWAWDYFQQCQQEHPLPPPPAQ